MMKFPFHSYSVLEQFIETVFIRIWMKKGSPVFHRMVLSISFRNLSHYSAFFIQFYTQTSFTNLCSRFNFWYLKLKYLWICLINFGIWPQKPQATNHNVKCHIRNRTPNNFNVNLTHKSFFLKNVNTLYNTL